MDKQQIAVMIPIIVSLGAFLMVFGLRYLQNKENMSMIERGINPADAKRRLEIDPSRTLKNGMMFVGAGIGLLLAIFISANSNLSEDSKTGLFFALIAIFGGAGMLGAYFYERKNPPTE